MSLLKSSALAGVGLCGLLAFGIAAAEDTNKPVAVVNGIPIPQSRLEFVLKMQAQQGQKETPEMRAQVRDVLVTREIIAQEAAKQGLDKSEEYQAQMDLARQQVLVNSYLEDHLKKNEPTEEQLKAEYERVKAEQLDPNAKEFKARHILVKTEKEATAILAQLKKGAKFDEIAKKKSTDTGSNKKGGELDWTDGNNMVKPFAEAMRALGKGQTSEKPVQSQYGFHIIRVDDIRTPQFPAYEDVKDQVAKQYLGKQRDALVETLRKAATVE
jgi:peptidyl-prolyl cis-trans isomerase C